MPSASAAGAALGFGSDNNMSIAEQVNMESEEERRRRLAQLKLGSRPGGIGTDYSGALGLSPAATSLTR